MNISACGYDGILQDSDFSFFYLTAFSGVQSQAKEVFEIM
jgi:hypothetical protein